MAELTACDSDNTVFNDIINARMALLKLLTDYDGLYLNGDIVTMMTVTDVDKVKAGK